MILLAAAAGGCSRAAPLVPVTGRVVFPDGAPVTFGTIEFALRSGGPPARSAIDAEGRFALQTAGRAGARSGEHTVIVVQLAVAEGVEPHTHKAPHTAPRRVSPRHAQAGRSGLSALVKPDTPNDLLITVTPLTSTPSR
jgi:hypothetical protein